MIRKLIYWLNLILYKKERFVVQVFPNFEDNGIAISNYLSEFQDKEVILINRTSRYKEYIEDKNVKVLSANSLEAIYYLVTSKYILFTHGSVLRKFSKRQKVFNLWHGYGYKPVGVFIGHKGIPANYTAATSSHCQSLFAAMFDVDIDTVKVTGFPRNDRLFGYDKTKVLSQLNIENSKSILFWLPTYRKSVLGDIRTDGKECGNPFGVEDFDIQTFNELLKKNSATCIVKPHPMAPKYDNDGEYSNVVFINDDFLHDNGISLYPLLGVCDCLISDLSSVIIDFTMVNKPIICFAEDIDHYRSTRGIEYDNFEEMVPGPVAKNIDEFYSILESFFLDNDLLPDKRLSLQRHFHRYVDNNSSKRVFEELMRE